jgi:hypothetical protein
LKVFSTIGDFTRIDDSSMILTWLKDYVPTREGECFEPSASKPTPGSANCTPEEQIKLVLLSARFCAKLIIKKIAIEWIAV